MARQYVIMTSAQACLSSSRCRCGSATLATFPALVMRLMLMARSPGAFSGGGVAGASEDLGRCDLRGDDALRRRPADDATVIRFELRPALAIERRAGEVEQAHGRGERDVRDAEAS